MRTTDVAGVPFNPRRERPRPVEPLPAQSDIDRVEGWRRLRMSWAAIARNLGLTVDAARRRFDPTYSGAGR